MNQVGNLEPRAIHRSGVRFFSEKSYYRFVWNRSEMIAGLFTI
jgi:hypothetical protein